MKAILKVVLFTIVIAKPDYLISQHYLSMATVKGKSGFVNEKGNWNIDPEYDEVTGFAYGLAAVRVGEHWGYIDHKGTYIITGNFDSADPFTENGYARVEINGMAYYVDINDNRIPEKEVIVFNDGLAVIQAGGKYGYIGRDYQWTIPPVFDKAWLFREGVARVKRNNRWYYINRLGYEKYIPSKSRSYQLNGQSPEFNKKRGKNKWGFADVNDEWAIPPVFDYAKSFSEGLAPVKMGNQWGYVDETGELVINATYDEAYVFKNGFASVKIKGLYGCIDINGNQVIKPKFDHPLYFYPFEKFDIENEIFDRASLSLVYLAEIDLPEILIDLEDMYVPDEKRTALVIGNSTYQADGFLKNPEHDAADMASALRKLGFQVNVQLNATQLSMKQAIDEFGEQLKGYDVGLFFYSGHGIQADGYNYLVPVDAVINSERDVEYTCVEAGRVLSRMEDSGNNTNIIVLDACRNNPFERSWAKESNGQGLAFMKAPSGSLIAYATAPGTTASDGFGENGLYTSTLLKHMSTSGVSILEVFQMVRSEVRKISSDQQVPWESTSLEGNFYFMK